MAQTITILSGTWTLGEITFSVTTNPIGPCDHDGCVNPAVVAIDTENYHGTRCQIHYP